MHIGQALTELNKAGAGLSYQQLRAMILAGEIATDRTNGGHVRFTPEQLAQAKQALTTH